MPTSNGVSDDRKTFSGPVSVIVVPFPAQGHLNQLLQVSCLIATYGLPVYYVGSAVHNRQARLRANALLPADLARVRFHDLPIAPFASPPPDPTAPHKFPSQLQPAWDASLALRGPVADFIRATAAESRRVVVIHDRLIAVLVQDVAGIPNAESYAFNCISAACQAKLVYETLGRPFPPPEMADLPPVPALISEGLLNFLGLQDDGLKHRSGDIYNTSRIIEPYYLDLLENEEVNPDRKGNWAIGPILQSKTLISSQKLRTQHVSLDWLDRQAPNSVIYVTFGTTTSLSNEEISELALGLERSQQKFIWVLRDADTADIFHGEVRQAELPPGFIERVKGRGLVVQDWAPQPEILAHPATGGFMSHCGWNSCIESMTLGVPMAAWPMHSDQPPNAILMTEVLRVGILVRKWVSGGVETVPAETVESIVRRLMASPEGDRLRERAAELASSLGKATDEGGVSGRELDEFIAHITRAVDLETNGPDSSSSSSPIPC